MVKKSEKLEIWKIIKTTSYFSRIVLIFFESSRTEDTIILRKPKKLQKSFEIFPKKLKNKSFGGISDILIFCFTMLECDLKIRKNLKKYEKNAEN